MGLLDRLAKAVADEITKAPNLPAGAVAMTEQQMRQGTGSGSYQVSKPLPSNPLLTGIPFGPSERLIPGAINPLQERGRPDPRRFEYLVAQNINITENRLVPFKTLRAAAEQIDILRRCIEVIKNKMVGLDWDITLSASASEKIVSESGGDHVRAMAAARDKFTDEISRLRDFWVMPDKANNMPFSDWLSMALEEILVIDALAIWPQRAVNDDLYGLQILDGSTIKPLLDDRGMRPMAPFPAFQQILYGFPRSEFTATSDDPSADGEFTSDELSYLVRNRRSHTVYGYSPVERALALADIYLRRQQWLRSEFTDGVLPELMFETDATFGNNPDLLRAYENIFNDNLSGQTEQRQRATLLPAGIKPIQFDSYGDRFRDTIDEFLVTSICGHFGVLPTEIGFTPKTGLGGKGHQEGESDSAQTIGLEPLAQWLSVHLTNISYTYLGMPRELEFKLMVSGRTDSEQTAKRDDVRLRSGGETINENRAARGLPLLDTPEADMPMLVAGQSVFLFSPDGVITAGTKVDENGSVVEPETPPAPPPIPGQETPPVVGGETPPPTPNTPPSNPEKAAAAEMRAFIRFVRKGYTGRPFAFEHIEKSYAEVLNKFIEADDLDSARWYAERYLGQ